LIYKETKENFQIDYLIKNIYKETKENFQIDSLIKNIDL